MSEQANKFTLDVQAASDKGQQRDHNEDMILLGDTIFRDAKIRMEFESGELLTFAVADGMGGHNAGEVASEMTLKGLLKLCGVLDTNYTEGHLKGMLNDWVGRMHEDLIEEGNRNPDRKDMGTTLCGFLMYSRKIYSFNAGDSRLYRYRRGLLRQLSQDHSLASQNPEAPSNIITNAIGGGGLQAYIDFEDITDMLDDGDYLLICSDGLTDMLKETEIEEIMEHAPLAQKLVDAANEAGGKDNISVLLAQFSAKAE